ncbi:uncharacterized protein Dyak_GE21191, isoform C [Drosophila yakuba]|uniref:Uncharacterized protein, isoform C n=1 Tax=Drosophila yakuba TaxID=7245 RepID=A0A0R1DZR5_DROYA|nr:uncharacterized protein Dyak_GE21191, isoform C [Drosophila yakuba]
MVLRSGIIIPFQFRDTKKLLMIGVPEENRNLNIWDLKNVVRAAFGIYNFEFRNKKIGFNIPDELLLHYLAQRHDLTNFVIEISQVYDVALDNYVLNRQCSCANQKMLNDSPTPEEPTNLCQPSNVLEAAPTPLMALPPCEDEDHEPEHEHEHEESMKYRIDKASSGAASAELGMPAYEACSPKMDYDTQDELPDSPHSQPLPPPPFPLPAALPLPPPPTSHHQHLQQQQLQQHEVSLSTSGICDDFVIYIVWTCRIIILGAHPAGVHYPAAAAASTPAAATSPGSPTAAAGATATDSAAAGSQHGHGHYYDKQHSTAQGADVQAAEGAVRALPAAAPVHQRPPPQRSRTGPLLAEAGQPAERRAAGRREARDRVEADLRQLAIPHLPLRALQLQAAGRGGPESTKLQTADPDRQAGLHHVDTEPGHRAARPGQDAQRLLQPGRDGGAAGVVGHSS